MPDLEIHVPGNMLIVALGGWNDAGDAASCAGDVLIEQLALTSVEEVEPDDFFDYHLIRPSYVVNEEGGRSIQWPTLRLHGPSADPDNGASLSNVFVLRGDEPSRGWRAFNRIFEGWIEQYNFTRVVFLGAMLADTPHTRPFPVMVTSENAKVRQQVGIEPNTYTGVVGILSVLATATEQKGVASAALWAYVPYYTDGITSAKGALALLNKVESVTGAHFDTSNLHTATLVWESQVSGLLEDDLELQLRISSLEKDFDSGESPYSVNTDYLERQVDSYLRMILPGSEDITRTD